MLIKQSVQFIRYNMVSCDGSRRNGILGSSLEKNIFLIEEKLGQPNYSVFHNTFDKRFLKFVSNSRSSPRTWQFHYAVVNQIGKFEPKL